MGSSVAETVKLGMNKKELPGPVSGHPAGGLLKIVLIFFGVILGFNLLEWFVLPPGQLELLQLATAKSASAVISFSGIATQLQGVHLAFGNVHWEIVSECTALHAMYVFLAFVLAYPSLWRSKWIAAALGLPFLFAANLFRLWVLAWGNQLFPQYADLIHDYVWQIAFLFLLVLMWLVWIDLVVKHEKIPEIRP